MFVNSNQFVLRWVLSFYFESFVYSEYFFMHKMLSKMYMVVYFACADDGIGRFDRSMLSHQDLMELFIFGLAKPEKICRNREDPADVCEWKGVKCNGDGEVEEFKWGCKHQHGIGTVDFEFLPCSMKSLQMWNNVLSGTIQLADLPGKIEVVYLLDNQIKGSLDLDRLPAAVRTLGLSSNKFTGEVSLENLPIAVQTLNLGVNQLSGAICLTSLPPALQSLCLRNNNFEGSLDFTRLPKSMSYIHLSDNRFSGTIYLGNLPQSMRVLDIR